MGTVLFGGGGRKNIVIEPFSDTQWRACDIRWSEHDARSLLGFIEKKGNDLFEVMQLDHGFEWFSFATLEAATAHFTTMNPGATPNSENVLSRLRAHA
ncbi:MAG TPA: hypothetical protein VIJ18_05135 [Microbacteriaceae bacterium]